ncbi:hypothetical protein T07_13497 [Trichinella nelsoni]|uniref:Uncharacterized protein n=1 Tax=Trichinella nelsoni TaxID=6336 RepID=A0A0V0RPS9_9BILA|nr:hypothetical protein T07_13497 [Trichinella nelsoni]
MRNASILIINLLDMISIRDSTQLELKNFKQNNSNHRNSLRNAFPKFALDVFENMTARRHIVVKLNLHFYVIRKQIRNATFAPCKTLQEWQQR